MSATPTHRYERNPDVVTREILGETLLVPISAAIADMSNIFALNDTGAFVWQLLDGETSLGGIRDGLSEAFEVTPDAAWDDLNALLADLADAGLVSLVE